MVHPSDGNPRINHHLGSGRLKRSYRFYKEGLGFPTTRAPEESIVFVQTGGVAPALYPYAALAGDVGPGWDERPQEFSIFTLAHNVRDRAEADEVLALARRAGAVVVKTAGDTFWGRYSGYFTDLDGYL